MNTKLISKTLIQNQNTIITRSYYTNRYNKSTLYSKISPLGSTPSLEPELDSWVQSGNKVWVAELQRIIHDLRKRKRFSHALQVSEWMHKKDICIFSPIHGLVSAENYFNNLRDQDKNEKTYGALLNCYVRQREMTNEGEHVLPDNFSYRLCINSYGARGDLEGMEKILNEMEHQPDIVMDWNTYAVAANFYIKGDLTDKAIDTLKKSEARLDKKDGTGYNHLISLYAKLGNKTEILRLWDLEKSACERHINKDYIIMMESLLKLSEFEEAEKVLKEWESSGNFMMFGKGLCEKAKALLEDLTGKGKMTLPNSWGVVATGFFDKSEVAKAFSCMKAALCLYSENKGWKPNQRVINGILSWLGDEGSAEDAEAFVSSLNTVIPMNREMYHAVLKANIRAGKEVHDFWTA
ncbi:pentatricopeptide repeat-containing protein [Salix suchowensis]|nr:pentatricopeptide repeat-containing protein [Salix suchowensis]